MSVQLRNPELIRLLAADFVTRRELVATAGNRITLTNTDLTVSGGGALTLSAAGSYTLTVPKTGTVPVGTGTAGRIAEWATDANTVHASTLIKSGAGVLTLSAAADYTLTVPATGTAALLGTANIFTERQRITVSSGNIFEGVDGTTTRTILARTGLQDWYLSNGVSEVGVISYSTPGGLPGILFRNASLGGRVDIYQYSSSGGGVTIYQRNSTGAVPVLCLRQDDVSEEMIRFHSTVASGNAINTDALGAYYGRVRVYVEGVGAKWIALYD